ncbi:phage DNA ejection protein [Escherichia coli]
MLYAFKLGRKLRGEEPYCPEKGGKGGSSDKSAKYAAEAQKYAADLQNQQWQTIMKNLAPFTPLAEQYVNQLQNLSSLEGQGQALNQYYNSKQYKDLAGQARYQSLAAAEATGGLGSTATSNQLATIAPTLGQSWLSNQMSNYNNLANVGLGALQGLSGIAGVFQQEKQAQRQKEFQQAYANAYASGDRGALRQLATQYPDQIESVRKGMGFIDEEQRNSIGTLAAGARLASSSPEAMQSWLQNNAGELARVGVNPHDVAQMYQQNPRQFGEFVDHLGMNSLGPEKYFDLQDKMQGRQVTMRGQDLDSQTAARNQAITMRGQDIQANLGQQRINLDAETNRINNENKRLDRMLSAETNDLKRQEIQSRIAANNQQLQQKQQALNDGYKDGINTLTTSMFTLNDIVSSPSLKSITGLRGVIPNVPGSQAADTQARLDTFKSQAYLTAVQAMRGMGALSDAEGKKLDQAVGSLQNSQSEESFRRNAGVILNTLNQKRNEAVGKYVQQNGIKRVEAPQASIDYLKQHPELSIDFINRYGYLPSLGQ